MAKAKAVSYKRTTTTSLKAAGILNIEDDGVYLQTDEGSKNISTLLSDFQGAVIELSATVKDVDDLPDPTEG